MKETTKLFDLLSKKEQLYWTIFFKHNISKNVTNLCTWLDDSNQSTSQPTNHRLTIELDRENVDSNFIDNYIYGHSK